MEVGAFQQMAKRSRLSADVFIGLVGSSKTNEIPRKSNTNPGKDRHLVGIGDEAGSAPKAIPWSMVLLLFSWILTIAAVLG